MHRTVADALLRVRASVPWAERDVPIPGGDPIGEEPPREGRSQTLAPEGQVAIMLPGFNFPPRGSLYLDDVGEGDVGPSGASANLYTLQVPDHQEFRFAAIAFDCADEAALADLLFTVTVGGHAATFLSRRAAIGTFQNPATVSLEIPGPVPVIIQATNNGFVTKHFFVRVIGWFYATRSVGREVLQ